MKEYQAKKEEPQDMVREEGVAYGDLEQKRLKEALQRTDTEKFYFLMTLMKMGNTMKKAVIHHKK